jgi:hypothetical protein
MGPSGLGSLFPRVECNYSILQTRFNLSQADFSKRCFLGDVLAQVSSDGTDLPTLCVHVPTAIPVPAEPAASIGGGCCFGGGTLDSRLSRFLFALYLSILYVWGLGSGGCAAAALPFLSLLLLLCCNYCNCAIV